jgi:hypothetical protein
VIYSRWRPDRGGYDYFESRERYGLGDDLPVPTLSGSSAIGVSSITAGRTARGPLVPVGSGPTARGMILPTSRDGLRGLGVLGATPVTLIYGGVGVIIGFLWARLWRKP